MKKPLASIFLALFMAGPTLASDNPAAKEYCGDDRTSGWNFYCDTIVPEEIPDQRPEEAPAAEIPQIAPPVSFTEQMMEFRKSIDELKHKAILEPTPENVNNYMRAQQSMVKKATLFTEVWQRQLFEDPTLDANVKRPLTSIGNNMRQDMLVAQREEALKTAASERGLMFVFENPEACMLCETQAKIISDLAKRYDIDVLPVSLDGFQSDHFPQSVPDAGQIATLGLAETPRPFIALVEPKSGAVDLIGAGLMTQDIILNRVRIITAVPEGELYE